MKPAQWEEDGHHRMQEWQSCPGAGRGSLGGAEDISVTAPYRGHLLVGVLQVQQQCGPALPHLGFIPALPLFPHAPR